MKYGRRGFLRAAGTGVMVGMAGCSIGGSSPEEQVEEHRDALSKYTDLQRAVDDGYEISTPYIRTDEGVLGLPFVNINAPTLEPEQPNVLFYTLEEDGTYSLLGVEWYAPTESYDSPPSMFGTEFHEATPGETDLMPEHYGLHAWLFEDNPDGLFEPYHTGVDAPSYIDEMETAWDSLERYYGDETVAEEAGYTNHEECAESTDGGYGIPAVRTDYTGTEVTEPAVLLYRFSSNWSYRVMGGEWYVPVDEVDSPPELFGQEFHGPMAGHSPEFDQGEHYGLHAWLFVGNPNGMFAEYNPIIQC